MVALIEYAIFDEDGDLVEASGDGRDGADDETGAPIAYVHGYGTLVPGLENALAGMAAGETREVVVPPAEAFGDWDEELEVWVDRGELPAEIQIDDELPATSDDGGEITVRVVEIADDAVLIDTNHPLAGESLRFDVIVHAVRPATPAELAAVRPNAPKPRLRVIGAAEAPTTAPDVPTWGAEGKALRSAPDKAEASLADDEQ